MVILTVSLRGSFGEERMQNFTAMTGGHAQAVAEAIKYLSEVEFPKAIRNDHECHRDGIEPSEGFGKLGKVLVPGATTAA